jgi:chromosome segregation ATPase
MNLAMNSSLQFRILGNLLCVNPPYFLHQAKLDSQVDLSCPCCKRQLRSDTEIEVFNSTIDEFMNDSTLIDRGSSSNAQELQAYQKMRKSIESKIDDLRDYRRLTDEANDLEKEIKRWQDELTHFATVLTAQIEARDEAQKVATELSSLVDTIRRWSDDASRVIEKKLQIQQKMLDLKATATDSTRDLKTVDRHISEMRGEKEEMSNKILSLNKEMSDLNNKISEISTSVSSCSYWWW